MARRYGSYAPYLVALLAVAASILGLVPRPTTGAPQRNADYVVVAGAAGLRWDDIDPTDTPTLWRLAQQGSIGALSVRSAHQPTCPGDGWISLGAGNYAQLTFNSMEDSICPRIGVTIESRDQGAALPEYNNPTKQGIVPRNRALPGGPQVGALAESVRCAAAVGPGGAVAAARPYGRVDRYRPVLPADPKPLLAECVLSFVDLGEVSGKGDVRRAAARDADARLARVLAARPERSLLIVAGLSDTDTTSRLHVAIADGPGYEGGWLTSSTTSRSGYLQLIDLAPTALAALGHQAPPKLFAGAPALHTEGRPVDLVAAVDRLSDADHEAAAQRRVAALFFAVLTVWQLALLAALVPVLRHAAPDAVRGAARAFNRVAWPAFAVLVVTGVWNVVAAGDEGAAYRTTLVVKLVVVAVSGGTAFLHGRARSAAALAVSGALTGLSALTALFLGVLLAG
jgi:hypothetical protein